MIKKEFIKRRQCPEDISKAYQILLKGLRDQMNVELDNNVLPITVPPLPFDLDAKIFSITNEEGGVIGEPYSYNDYLQEMKNISGVNEDLLGKMTRDQND